MTFKELQIKAKAGRVESSMRFFESESRLKVGRYFLKMNFFRVQLFVKKHHISKKNVIIIW